MDSGPNSTRFRTWLREVWYEHCDEILSITGHNPDYFYADYFAKYKWWLKAEYKRKMKETK